MAKQSKKPADLNRLAAAIVGEATDETPQEPESQQVVAGRSGGLKGGKAGRRGFRWRSILKSPDELPWLGGSQNPNFPQVVR